MAAACLAAEQECMRMEEDQALLTPRTPRRRRQRPSNSARRTPCVALATVLIGVLLVAATFAALRAAGDSVVVRNTLGQEVTQLRGRACSEYPYLKFDMDHPVLHSNLGGKGPDKGAEGIVFDTIDLGAGAGTELGHQVIMVVNATSNHYSPFSARQNGMQGKYGSININSGHSIDLRFHFYDRRTMDPYTLAEAAWTFFDLDTGTDGKSIESVTFHKNYKHYHLTPHTEVKVEDLGNRTKFSGSTFGIGADNPRDPMRLTHQQKNRAVTLTFENLSELRVQLSATLGLGPRFFTFVSRPSLMCAVTVQEGYEPPFDDIIARAPLQQSVQSDYDVKEKFGTLLVKPGQKVRKGDPVFTVKLPDGSTKTYTSGVDGTVAATQTQLKPGDDLQMRLDNKTIVVVEREQFDSLVTILPGLVPGGPAQVTHNPEQENNGEPNPNDPPNPADLDGYWCGPGCTGGPGHEVPQTGAGAGGAGGAPGGTPGGGPGAGGPGAGGPGAGGPGAGGPGAGGPVPQISKDATFLKYLKEPGDPVSPGEPIMTVKDGGKIIAITSPELGVVKSREEGMKEGDKVPAPGPFNLMDIRPEVTGDAKFVEYYKNVGDPVALGDPLIKVENIFGEEVIIKAKTIGVVKARQEGIHPGDPIAVSRDQNLMTIGPIPALPTGPTSLKAGMVPKRGQELVGIKVKPGDLIQEGQVVAVVKDVATGEETPVLADHDGLVTAVNAQLKPGDPIDRTGDGNLVTTGKFHPLPVKPPLQWPTKNTAGPGTKFVQYNVLPGDHIKAGDTIATVKKPDGTEVPLKADKDGVVTAIQDALQPGMALDDVMEDENLATIAKFDKLPALPVNPADEWPSENEERDNGPHCRFVMYHVEPGDVVHTGDPIATVEKADGTEVDILADKPGVVKDIQEGLKPGADLDDTMEDDNLATIGKLPPLEVKPGEAGCCTPGEDSCPFGGPFFGGASNLADTVAYDGAGGQGPSGHGPSGQDPAAQDPAAQTLGGQSPYGQPASEKGPWTFEEWRAEVYDPVEKGDPIAVVKNKRTGEEKEVLASKNGNVIRRQEALQKGDVVDDVMEDTDIAVIGRFNPLDIGLTEMGVAAPMDAIFVKWYHLVGDEVKFSDNIAQVRLGVKTKSGRRLMKDLDIASPGTGTVIEEMDLKPGQSIGDQSLSPNIAKIGIGWPWWLLFLAMLMLLCCVLCCFYYVMKKKRPSFTPMAAEPEAPPAVEPEGTGLRLDFQDDGKVRTVWAKYRPLGIKHNFIAPIVAHDFTINSYAKQALGVQDGWKLRRIGREELHDNPNFDEVNGKLQVYMQDFELWPLPLEFAEERADGMRSKERKLFRFAERPIGIEFKNRAPVQVDKVFEGSPAAAAGVQVGWYVTKIAEIEVTETTTFHEVMDAFKEGVTPLDDSGKTYSKNTALNIS